MDQLSKQIKSISQETHTIHILLEKKIELFNFTDLPDILQQYGQFSDEKYLDLRKKLNEKLNKQKKFYNYPLIESNNELQKIYNLYILHVFDTPITEVELIYFAKWFENKGDKKI